MMTTTESQRKTNATHVKVVEAGATKKFTAAEFKRAMRSNSLVVAVLFWRELELIAQPDERTRLHARGVLRALAEGQFNDCGGIALTPQHAEVFRYCGFEPVRIAPPGALAW